MVNGVMFHLDMLTGVRGEKDSYCKGSFWRSLWEGQGRETSQGTVVVVCV